MARKTFEGSKADKKQDKAGAKKAGMSLKAWEKSPQDRREDKAGQRTFFGKSKSKGKR